MGSKVTIVYVAPAHHQPLPFLSLFHLFFQHPPIHINKPATYPRGDHRSMWGSPDPNLACLDGRLMVSAPYGLVSLAGILGSNGYYDQVRNRALLQTCGDMTISTSTGTKDIPGKITINRGGMEYQSGQTLRKT
ncbi:hypothetical protein N7510_010980 [Penicillium lagena]|uniref:uncharacterized protein n=1 Tax=Penicillium lagena TaxID=94218 RepID=UPI002541F853|nr:uncharacterized protein N7510_010980 [Penicillium lagena]KAJ5601446.1 hypothetical protein N7510_010980 [Penicillium lagena]